MEKLCGTIDLVTYQNDDNGYTVFRVVTADGAAATCAGTAPAARVGQSVCLTGKWVTHKRFGRQFEISACEIVRPTTESGITHLLESGLVSNIGAKRARMIVDKFGLDTLNVLDNEPHKLAAIPGIGKKTLGKIKASWDEQKHIRDLVLFLREYDISVATANRVYKTYGGDAKKKICENPYALINDIWGVGFIKADEIAVKMGFDHKSYKRIKAGLTFVLQEAAGDGHTFLPKPDLEIAAAELLKVDAEQIVYTIDNCVNNNFFACEDGCVYLQYLYRAEKESAKNLAARLVSGEDMFAANKNVVNAKNITDDNIVNDDISSGTNVVNKNIVNNDISSDTNIVNKNISSGTITVNKNIAENKNITSDGDINEFIANYSLTTGWQGAPEQLDAVRMAAKNKIFVLTGGPGTGKTTVLQVIVAYFRHKNLRVELAAPTGRAAARMGSISGVTARTLHRLLEFKPKTGGGFAFMKNESNTLDADVIILDEVSMIDITLLNNFLAAARQNTALVFVGDANQLPSVGPGNVLADLIACKKIPHIELTKIFRQSAQSRIVTAAHEIIGGETPEFANAKNDNCFLLAKNDPQECLDTIVDLVCRRLPAKYGFDPMTDIQVLAPMHKGTLGTLAINAALQKSLNASPRQITFGKYIFKCGDRVIQTKNNYEAGVFNGDIGFITAIDEGGVSVTFDKTPAQYRERELDQIIPAYCISIHKSQGSEFRAVVIPVSTQHFIMLQRNLFYTALTRARELCVFVGTKRALATAVNNDRALTRNSRLCDLIEK